MEFKFNLTYLSLCEQIPLWMLFGKLVLCNGLIDILPVTFITNHFNISGPVLYIAIVWAAHDQHGLRIHYLPGVLGNAIFLILLSIEYLFEWRSIFLYLILYLINIFTIYLVLFYSGLWIYKFSGKYKVIGHREFRLSNQAWVSVFYPANLRKEWNYDNFEWLSKEDEKMKSDLKYYPYGDKEIWSMTRKQSPYVL